MLAASVAVAAGAPRADVEVRVASTDHSTELIKTVPIGKRAGAKPRVLLSLDADRLGELRSGDRLEVSADAQFSTCLKPNTNHTDAREDCVGRVYAYNPSVDARLVLAADAGSAQGVQVGDSASLTCTQDQPDRNHHCTLAVPWGGDAVEDLEGAGCLPSGCRLNLVVSSWDKKAKSGDLLIVGGIEGGKKIEYKGKAKASSIVYRPGDAPTDDPNVVTSPRQNSMPLVDDGDKPKLDVVYSLPLQDLRAGESLKIEGRYAASISSVPYNVRTRAQLIFADSPSSTKTRSGSTASKVADTTPAITEQNNFNCTQGKSGHQNPCPIDKAGILRIRNSTTQTLYINLVAGHGAIINAENQHWRNGDEVEIPEQGGYVKAWRYGG